MTMTTEERSRRASRARSLNARRRRFQRALQEMRESGLVVLVLVEDPEIPDSMLAAAEYTPEETHAAVYGK
jgi:hypothetical protein